MKRTSLRLAGPIALLGSTLAFTPATAQGGDQRFEECGRGHMMACFSLEFGACADPNPRVAIPVCTRQLLEQDNRKIPGNLRANRATRYALRANAYAKQGDTENALDDYDRAVRSYRGTFWIQMQRGDAHFLRGNNEEALKSYDAAAELEPNSAVALAYRATLLAAAPEDELRDPAQALLDAQRANELAPGQPDYVDVLAVAYAANGNFEKAVEEAQRAIDLLPAGELAREDDLSSRLALYRQGMVFRMAP